MTVSKVVMAYYLGIHACMPKPNTNKYMRLGKEAVVRNSTVGACTIQQAEVSEAVVQVILQRHEEEPRDFPTAT